jgi:three-Cys-motif partner protein
LLGDIAIANFKWGLGSAPPKLKSHSAAKLRLIKRYLDSYFDTVLRNPVIERLQITLVDGFCGGGTFDDNGIVVDGTPFLLLNSVRDAERRLNANRSKKLLIDAQFHFIDKSTGAIAYLKDDLFKRGYLNRIGSDIHLHAEEFENAAPKVCDQIYARTRRKKGRSLFILDQKGYSDAPLSTIRSIFERFEKAECILTFAVDWLIDYLSDRPEMLAAVKPVELSLGQIQEMLKLREGAGGRYVIQRLLLRHLSERTNADYRSPFFIRSKEANKDLWLVHLSQHATARNVMVDSHWSVKNHSVHPGRGGLEIMGFDPDFDPAVTSDFMFADHEVGMMKERLAEDMIRRIREMTDTNAIKYGTFLDSIANETPARLADLDLVTSFLAKENELTIMDAQSTQRRSLRPNRSDLIEVNRQQKMFFSKK